MNENCGGPYSRMSRIVVRMIGVNRKRLNKAREEDHFSGIGGIYWHMARIEALENVKAHIIRLCTEDSRKVLSR